MLHIYAGHMKQLLIVFILIQLTSFKIDPTKGIDKEINRINSNKSLAIKKFDANKVYDRHFDNGGEIRLFLDDNKLVKIFESLGYEYGKTTITIYLKRNDVIAIKETEEDFPWQNGSTLDMSKLKKVFDMMIYVDEWKMINTHTIGKRIHSESMGEVTEYKELVEKAEELLTQKN